MIATVALFLDAGGQGFKVLILRDPKKTMKGYVRLSRRC